LGFVCSGSPSSAVTTRSTRFGQRNGGYTRIVRLGNRKGDGTDVAIGSINNRLKNQ
jgi:ribosomal protein L17